MIGVDPVKNFDNIDRVLRKLIQLYNCLSGSISATQQLAILHSLKVFSSYSKLICLNIAAIKHKAADRAHPAPSTQQEMALVHRTGQGLAARQADP
jgi:hypothetical protein